MAVRARPQPSAYYGDGTMNEQELKPCPFCGGVARVKRNGFRYKAKCQTCYANGPEFEQMPRMPSAKEKCVTAWNRRDGELPH